tara:strand:+ start:180 stop:677 length:498 start_codon:yes stop_codon:yes gene_type:complete
MSEDAYEAAISAPNLTAEEKRNLELTKAWSVAYGDLDNIEHFCDLYADSTEIYTPLQDWYYAKQGHSNQPWRDGEIGITELFGHREEKIVSILAQGDTVAVQMAVEITSKEGQSRTGAFAAFLKFDADGKITSDHSFLGRHPRPTADQGPPAYRAMIEKLQEINP